MLNIVDLKKVVPLLLSLQKSGFYMLV